MIKWPKSAATYRGACGFGYMCGMAFLTQPNEKTIRLEAINSSGQPTYSCWMEIPIDQIELVAASLLATVKKPAENNPLSVESLMAQYGDWGEHELYIREDWAHETASKNTQRGYWDWVSVRLEVDKEMQD
jgi:hypothetical protein